MPKMEKTSERMLRDVKEWMLQERSSKECATLPEDTIQRIMVGVSNKIYFFKIIYLIIFELIIQLFNFSKCVTILSTGVQSVGDCLLRGANRSKFTMRCHKNDESSPGRYCIYEILRCV